MSLHVPSTIPKAFLLETCKSGAKYIKVQYRVVSLRIVKKLKFQKAVFHIFIIDFNIWNSKSRKTIISKRLAQIYRLLLNDTASGEFEVSKVPDRTSKRTCHDEPNLLLRPITMSKHVRSLKRTRMWPLE